MERGENCKALHTSWTKMLTETYRHTFYMRITYLMFKLNEDTCPGSFTAIRAARTEMSFSKADTNLFTDK